MCCSTAVAAYPSPTTPHPRLFIILILNSLCSAHTTFVRSLFKEKETSPHGHVSFRNAFDHRHHPVARHAPAGGHVRQLALFTGHTRLVRRLAPRAAFFDREARRGRQGRRSGSGRERRDRSLVNVALGRGVYRAAFMRRRRHSRRSWALCVEDETCRRRIQRWYHPAGRTKILGRGRRMGGGNV